VSQFESRSSAYSFLITWSLFIVYLTMANMLSNWWYPPAPEGNRSSLDESRVDTDDDTQIVEPDQGNGKCLESVLSRLLIPD
jgi:hypothetical protein